MTGCLPNQEVHSTMNSRAVHEWLGTRPSAPNINWVSGTSSVWITVYKHWKKRNNGLGALDTMQDLRKYWHSDRISGISPLLFAPKKQMNSCIVNYLTVKKIRSNQTYQTMNRFMSQGYLCGQWTPHGRSSSINRFSLTSLGDVEIRCFAVSDFLLINGWSLLQSLTPVSDRHYPSLSIVIKHHYKPSLFIDHHC